MSITQRNSESPEHALRLLGNWFKNRVEKNYTISDAFEISKKATMPIHRVSTDNDYEDAKSYSLMYFSIERHEQKAQTFFTQLYSPLEALSEGLEVDGIKLEQVPEEIRHKYYNPFLKPCEELGKFVNKVRKKSLESFTEDLPYSEIDKIFKNTFKNSANFAKIYNNLASSALLSLTPSVINKEIPQDEFQETQRILKATEPFINQVLKKVFRDLD